MHIALITPYGAESQNGNWQTAARWAAFLREAGHRVEVATHWNGEPVELMIALHARRSALSIQSFAAWQPESPMIVVLTGTDLYRDIRCDADAKKSLDLAHRLVVLQERGLDELSAEQAAKTRVIYQSAPDNPHQARHSDSFTVLVIGHLREEKDPFRAALASAYLPGHSHVRIVQLGRALSDEMAETACGLENKLSRYRWLGEVTHQEVLNQLAQAKLLVVSSNMEGGANVICEALAAGVPVIASDIPGNIGMLGKDYPGYYPLCDEQALAHLLARAESEPAFYDELKNQCGERRRLMTPEREAESLRKLIGEFEAGLAK